MYSGRRPNPHKGCEPFGLPFILCCERVYQRHVANYDLKKEIL